MVITLLTVTAFVVIVVATIVALMNDKRDRAKQRHRQLSFDDECREYWRTRGYYPIVPPAE